MTVTHDCVSICGQIDAGGRTYSHTCTFVAGRILEIADPYCIPVVGAYTDWTPLQDRETLFEEVGVHVCVCSSGYGAFVLL